MKRLEHLQSKIISIAQAAQMAEIYRLSQQKVVFTNGCFDLLHLGHITYLAQAAGLGNKLFVAVNDDASVRGLAKGTNRPINPEFARAMVLASLGFVDHVLVFSDPTPLKAIEAIQPDFIVKGADYDASVNDKSDKRYIVGKNEAVAWGGIAQTIPLVEGYSTTLLLSRG
ncbi:MAG: adenylyltransferase/cytidyltransferase family protein [Bacteroidota bacterium]